MVITGAHAKIATAANAATIIPLVFILAIS